MSALGHALPPILVSPSPAGRPVRDTIVAPMDAELVGLEPRGARAERFAEILLAEAAQGAGSHFPGSPEICASIARAPVALAIDLEKELAKHG